MRDEVRRSAGHIAGYFEEAWRVELRGCVGKVGGAVGERSPGRATQGSAGSSLRLELGAGVA